MNQDHKAVTLALHARQDFKGVISHPQPIVIKTLACFVLSESIFKSISPY